MLGIGVMVGSSCDGIDIAAVKFEHDAFKLIATDYVPIPKVWKVRLSELSEQSAAIFCKTDIYFGHYLGELVATFIEEYQLQHADFIASHGFTVFHEPKQRLSVQIGDGAAIAAISGIQTITNFRSTDVALGGQGAPLAPILDTQFFPDYAACINLGGIANISYPDADRSPKGYDISPCNQILNMLSEELGQSFDENGKFGKKGKLDDKLLSRLENHPFYKKKPPRSLDTLAIHANFFPLFDELESSFEDQLATVYHHLAKRISRSIERVCPPNTKILMSGGGAKNSFLIDQIQNACSMHSIEVADSLLLDFKECVLMVLLGKLRLEQKPNSAKSITGASANTINGAVYLP